MGRRAAWSGRAALLVGVVAAVSGTTVLAAIDRLDGPATVAVQAVRGERYVVDPQPPAATAVYRVSFVVEWGPSTHPATLPPGSHLSPLVVATHTDPGALFAVGTIASPGVESMAETGATATLVGELGSNGSVAEIATGRRIDGPGTDVIELTASQDAGLLSLVSMLAPSPDWFVGVRDVELFGTDGWIPSADLPVGAYDSGTDSGAAFTSPNVDTNPALPISGPRDAAFQAAAAEASFGRVVIERIG